MLLQEAFLLSAFWFAVSTAFFSHANRSYNNKEHQHRHGHTRVNSDGGVIRRKYPLDVRLFQPSRMTPAQWKSSSSSSLAAAAATTRQKIQEHQELVKVGDCIGSGSYGTVHLLTVRNMKSDDTFECIGKRAWTLQELEKQTLSKDASDVKDRAKRCAYYWGVGRHCFEKLPPHVGLPIYRGVLDDDSTSDDGSQGPWLLFDFAEGDNNAPAPCLQDIMAKDRLDQKEHHQHHLHFLQQALRAVSTESDLCSNPVATTIEALLEQLLQVLHHVHDHNIVHRDVKPGNLLLSDGHVILIDFGSAADVDTAGILKENIGWGDRVSISPVYAAPEVFCDPNRSAVNFDTFSVGLIACQLLFQYLDERTDAGFLQQLTAVDNDLDAWLKSQWQSKVLPAGLVEGLDVLSDRPGLWGLIQGMLQTDPTDRLSSAEALKRLREIRAGKVTSDADGTYLNSIFTALEEPCPVSVPVARALDFVASFRRGESLGLVLAQADAADTSEMDAAALILWNQAVEGSGPGQVFVQGIVEGGQADEAGIFEIGDQLQGVGELPVAQGGFEKVVEMLGQQPKSAKYTTLHFDRKSARVGNTKFEALPIPSMEGPIQVSDQGAWSSQGRRKAQEDAFVVVEVHDTKDRSILLAGIMDGHLGKGASNLVRENLPQYFSEELLRGAGTGGKTPVESILQTAWEQTCDAYGLACTSEDACIAEYDPREGILMANTGSADTAAGTTTCVVALDKNNGYLAVLNCGDSRGLVIDREGELVFKTYDHKPDREIERFAEGVNQGLDYHSPECRMSRWYVPVGDFNYAVSRSLEGPFATSKGIVSTPDISTLQATAGTTVAVASDGLWEVMDSTEVANITHRLRFKQSMSAGDAAKTLCSMALERGSTDNVSVVILYLD